MEDLHCPYVSETFETLLCFLKRKDPQRDNLRLSQLLVWKGDLEKFRTSFFKKKLQHRGLSLRLSAGGREVLQRANYRLDCFSRAGPIETLSFQSSWKMGSWLQKWLIEIIPDLRGTRNHLDWP